MIFESLFEVAIISAPSGRLKEVVLATKNSKRTRVLHGKRIAGTMVWRSVCK